MVNRRKAMDVPNGLQPLSDEVMKAIMISTHDALMGCLRDRVFQHRFAQRASHPMETMGKLTGRFGCVRD